MFIMFTVVKPITNPENGSTRKLAIGKSREEPGNVDHLSQIFPLDLCLIEEETLFTLRKCIR